MPLDGLRAWIGEVERKLGMRTRVFLVLATIALGGAGAAIYLALDTRDDAVSESDVRALQEKLEGQIVTGGAGGGSDLTQLEAQLDALRAEVEELRGKDAAGQEKGGASGSGGIEPDTGTGTAGAASDEAAPDRSGTNAPSGATDDATKGRLGDLFEEAKRQNEQAEKAERTNEDR